MIVAVDPGEKHNGVAWFEDKTCVRTEEWTPGKLYDYLEKARIEMVVIEEYRLYPWLLQEQGFSEVKTVGVIGVVRYICQKRRIPVVMQPASIKRATFAQMKARRIKLIGRSQHEKDAEAHCHYYIWYTSQRENVRRKRVR